ncbi:FecR family protein [Sinomicrobium oceani]|uniref:FecR family protein n=1 Tax=Sinomicrobium oceani TaxID=1150368 RepID=UPI00227D3AC8|nr:FecR family protein [Sinomicrobium oceani]
MPNPEIEYLLVKYLGKDANSMELDILNKWIEDPENEKVFREFIKTHYAIILYMNNDQDQNNDIKKYLIKEIRKDKNVIYHRRFRKLMAYAAMAILFFAVGYLFEYNVFSGKEDFTKVSKTEGAVTIQMENGDIKTIDTEGEYPVTDDNGKRLGTIRNGKLMYTKKDFSGGKKIVYNTLNVPNGKRFDIVLSDGTHVFLNSGSSLKYPVVFPENGKRKVYLEGEAFFDVTHHREHPFVVRAQNLHVEVLGTTFNLSNYSEDDDTSVVLVNGAVSLSSSTPGYEQEKLLLQPGYKGILNKQSKQLSRSRVNTALYTSWIKGEIILRHESFDNIVEKLERYYNVNIINNNDSLKYEKFNATIKPGEESIEQVLRYFNAAYKINYEIIENRIVIN